MPPGAERNVGADLTSKNSGILPLSSLPSQLAAPAPPFSATGSSRHPPAKNPKSVALRQKRKAESEGERPGPVTRRIEVNVRAINFHVQERVRVMKETAETENDEQRLKDMPFGRKVLFELVE